jgi:hypothetical protein
MVKWKMDTLLQGKFKVGTVPADGLEVIYIVLKTIFFVFI